MKKMSMVLILGLGTAFEIGCTSDNMIMYAIASNNNDSGTIITDRYEVNLSEFKRNDARSTAEKCPPNLSDKVTIATENCVFSNTTTKLNCYYEYEIPELKNSEMFNDINFQFVQQEYDLIDEKNSGACEFKKENITINVNNQDVAVIAGRSSHPQQLNVKVPKVSTNIIKIALSSDCSAMPKGCNTGKWMLSSSSYFLN